VARRGDGLYLRGKDKNIWWWDCTVHGHRYQLPIGKGISRTVARELVAIKRAAILKGEAGIDHKRKDCSFEKAKEAFLKHTKTDKRPRTFRTYQECLTRLSESFQGKSLRGITTWLVEKHKQSRAQAGARVRANREIAVLKNLFNFTIRLGLYHGANPVTGVKLFREEKRKFRYLEPEEEYRFVHELKEPLRTLIIVGIHCGVRIQSEGLTLQWENIDLEQRLLSVEAAFAKNGEHRVIPLNTTAHQALVNLQQTTASEFVFARNNKPYRHIRKSFDRACARAQLHGVTPHVLRHTFASRLVMSGVDLRTVQELGGWKDLGMVMRYSHLSPSHKADAVQRIAVENSPTISPTFKKDTLVECV